MHRGVKTPQCPKYHGVAILDPLNIQKSPKCQRVETPRCPMYQRVETSRCPKYRGVRTPQYFVRQNSLVSYVPGSRFFLYSWNLQAHAASFKATLIQKTVHF